MSDTAARAAFEAWFKALPVFSSEISVPYVGMRFAWRAAWSEATKVERERIADLYVDAFCPQEGLCACNTTALAPCLHCSNDCEHCNIAHLLRAEGSE